MASLWTAAVRPTAEAPLPVVYTARWDTFSIYLRNYRAAGREVMQARSGNEFLLLNSNGGSYIIGNKNRSSDAAKVRQRVLYGSTCFMTGTAVL